MASETTQAKYDISEGMPSAAEMWAKLNKRPCSYKEPTESGNSEIPSLAEFQAAMERAMQKKAKVITRHYVLEVNTGYDLSIDFGKTPYSLYARETGVVLKYSYNEEELMNIRDEIDKRIEKGERVIDLRSWL